MPAEDDPDGLRLFERELRGWGRLSNPNLAEVLTLARRLVALDGPIVEAGPQATRQLVRARQSGSDIFTIWVRPGFVDHRRQLPGSEPAVQEGLWRTWLTGARGAATRRRADVPVATATCPNCFVRVPLGAAQCGSCDWVPGT